MAENEAGISQDRPLHCDKCGADFLVKRFRVQLNAIVDYCSLTSLKLEYGILLKAKDMYQKFPESKERMVPSRKLGTLAKPTEKEVKMWTGGDALLSEYLLSRSFNIDARLLFLENKILSSEKNVKYISCPECGEGHIIFKEGRLIDFVPKF